MSARDALLGSSFAVAKGGEPGGARLGAWGRFATGSFDGEENNLTLRGDVTTAFVGADLESGHWLGGLALGVSEGEGTFDLRGAADSGTIESTLTAAYPYLRWRAHDRLDLWAMGGLGSGEMSIRQTGRTPHQTDISMRMGALGVTGALLEPPPDGGLALDLRSDVMHVRMASEARTSAAGNLAAAEADVTRLRLILEGSRPFETRGGGHFTPSGQIGLRQDAGDAETGTGLELGGGLTFARGALEVGATARALVAHEDSGYKEWGASGHLRLNPSASGRGPSLTLAPVWGEPGSATEQLYGLQHTRGLAHAREFDPRSRLDAELGYGFLAPGAPGVVTPYTALSWAEKGGHTLRVGARWNLAPGAVLGPRRCALARYRGRRRQCRTDVPHRTSLVASIPSRSGLRARFAAGR